MLRRFSKNRLQAFIAVVFWFLCPLAHTQSQDPAQPPTKTWEPTQAGIVYTDFDVERGRVRREDIFRSWRVVNTKSRNSLGHVRSYQLVPGGHGVWKDGLPNPVLKGDFFITAFKPDEFPYTTLDRRKMLEALTSYLDDEPLPNSDIVAWYRLSFVHQPRSEDWPDQPIVWHSFDLIPRDFLDESPLDATPIP
jgi:Cu2+-containing amine oxidase